MRGDGDTGERTDVGAQPRSRSLAAGVRRVGERGSQAVSGTGGWLARLGQINAGTRAVRTYPFSRSPQRRGPQGACRGRGRPAFILQNCDLYTRMDGEDVCEMSAPR